jgi:hypothetical protein
MRIGHLGDRVGALLSKGCAMPEPKPLVFTLTEEEATAILEPHGGGGQQSFHQSLLDKLENGNRALEFDDRHLGELIRYMQYGWDKKGGGFQSRLHKAFARSLKERLKL